MRNPFSMPAHVALFFVTWSGSQALSFSQEHVFKLMQTQGAWPLFLKKSWPTCFVEDGLAQRGVFVHRCQLAEDSCQRVATQNNSQCMESGLRIISVHGEWNANLCLQFWKLFCLIWCFILDLFNVFQISACDSKGNTWYYRTNKNSQHTHAYQSSFVCRFAFIWW